MAMAYNLCPMLVVGSSSPSKGDSGGGGALSSSTVDPSLALDPLLDILGEDESFLGGKVLGWL